MNIKNLQLSWENVEKKKFAQIKHVQHNVLFGNDVCCVF